MYMGSPVVPCGLLVVFFPGYKTEKEVTRVFLIRSQALVRSYVPGSLDF